MLIFPLFSITVLLKAASDTNATDEVTSFIVPYKAKVPTGMSQNEVWPTKGDEN
jgi:hypothetical protein